MFPATKRELPHRESSALQVRANRWMLSMRYPYDKKKMGLARYLRQCARRYREPPVWTTPPTALEETFDWAAKSRALLA